MTKIKAELQRETASFKIYMMLTDISRCYFRCIKQGKDFSSHTTNFGHIQTKRKLFIPITSSQKMNNISSTEINRTERCNS